MHGDQWIVTPSTAAATVRFFNNVYSDNDTTTAVNRKQAFPSPGRVREETGWAQVGHTADFDVI